MGEEMDVMSDKIKTYHVRCGKAKCVYNHTAICFAGIITLDDAGVCLCCLSEEIEEEKEYASTPDMEEAQDVTE
jgi:hypothetical protein